MKKSSSMNRFLFLSLGLHLSLVGAMILLRWRKMDPPLKVERAIRIDMVALPDKIKEGAVAPKPLSTPPKDLPKTVEAPPPPKPSEAKSQPKAEVSKIKAKPLEPKLANKPLRSASTHKGQNKIEQLKALENLSRKLETEAQLNQELKKLVFKGNQIVDGNSLTGQVKEEAEAYVLQVEDHLRSYWKLPQYLKDSKFRAKTLVRWDSNGRLTTVQFVETSGHDSFDELVMQTIQSAAPFPAPPLKFIAMMRQQGVIFGFPE